MRGSSRRRDMGSWLHPIAHDVGGGIGARPARLLQATFSANGGNANSDDGGLSTRRRVVLYAATDLPSTMRRLCQLSPSALTFHILALANN
ncbi:unnamed protein product [Urochloa humidicola]